MITEHDIILMQSEAEAYFEKLMGEYMRSYLGVRADIGGGYAEDIYGQEGRGPAFGGEEAGLFGERIAGLQPRRS